MQITKSDFQKEVLEASYTKPVLVDFWAEWCGPCRILSPLLEKLEKDYKGKWKLVKINTDYEPELAMQFRVTGIPHCVLFKEGKAIDSFTGALPEIHIRKLLDKYLPNEENKIVLELLQSNNYEKIKEGIQKTIENQISNIDIIKLIWNHLNILFKNQEIDFIKKILNFLIDNKTDYVSNASSILEYLKKFETDKDFNENFSKILELSNIDKQKEILEYFYKKIENNLSEKHKLKEHLITCFFILGQNHPLSNEYRKKLAKILY